MKPSGIGYHTARATAVAVLLTIWIGGYVAASHTGILPSNIYAQEAGQAISRNIKEGKTAEDVAFTDISKKAPYCAIDPTCINIITNSGMAEWQHEFRGGIGLNKMAIPNAVLFLFVISLMLYVVLLFFGKKVATRRLLITLISVFASLEVIRWFAEVEPYEPNMIKLVGCYLFTISLFFVSIWGVALLYHHNQTNQGKA